jgi:hypothetical protein
MMQVSAKQRKHDDDRNGSAMTKRKVPQQIDLVYRLDGSLREIDVFRLAPALQGIGELIQAAHLELNTEHEVGVNVKPFGKGSFVVEISLYVQTHFSLLAVGALVASTAISNTTHVLEAIGMIKSKTESLIGAIKKLRGKPERVEQVGPSEYRYESTSSSVTVSGDVHNLFQNATIHAAAVYVFAKPVEQSGVTGIETYLRQQEERTKVVISREDAEAFENFSSSEIPNPLPIEEMVSDPTPYYLKPKRVSLEGEPNNWSFRYGQNQTMTIDIIRDDKFLDDVRKDVYRLTADDLIVAEVIHKQKIRGTQFIGDPRNELLRVTEYRPATHHQQDELFNGDQKQD